MNSPITYRAWSLAIAVLLMTLRAASCGGDCQDDAPKPGKSDDDKWEEMEKRREVVTNADSDNLQTLMFGADEGSAVRAAWEQVRRRLAKDIAADSHRDPKGTLFKGVSGFVGFLEGRLRVPVPRWWASELERARTVKADEAAYFYDQAAGEFIFGPRAMSDRFGIVPAIKRSETGELIATWSGGNLRLAAKDIPEEKFFDSVTGVVYRDRCLIVQYSNDSFPPLTLAIYCVDLRSSQITWTRKAVFDARPPRAHSHSGASIHGVALVSRDDVVFVFGMELSMIYIESVRLTDGRAVMRFSDMY
jgi:hypothetical protein